MSDELIAILMFASMLGLLATGQRIFVVIGAISAGFALWLWGSGGVELPFNASKIGRAHV